jgi:26S proteasome regulatory subunit N9
VEELESELSTVDGVTSVHTRFYEFTSAYYRATGNHGEYYKNALRYLGCLDSSRLDTLLSAQERHERAYYLSLAAILGDGIYNFGELVR